MQRNRVWSEEGQRINIIQQTATEQGPTQSDTPTTTRTTTMSRSGGGEKRRGKGIDVNKPRKCPRTIWLDLPINMGCAIQGRMSSCRNLSMLEHGAAHRPKVKNLVVQSPRSQGGCVTQGRMSTVSIIVSVTVSSWTNINLGRMPQGLQGAFDRTSVRVRRDTAPPDHRPPGSSRGYPG